MFTGIFNSRVGISTTKILLNTLNEASSFDSISTEGIASTLSSTSDSVLTISINALIFTSASN
jgi:hypothetical protein